VHVDGAFGLWAAASPRLRSLAAALDLAAWRWGHDSRDGHDWGSQAASTR
jgi:hypothetical protein